MKKPASKIYLTTNWSSYNQTLIKRGNISTWFDPQTKWYAQPQAKHGRNQTYSDTAIQCCLMIKSIFRLFFAYGHRLCAKPNSTQWVKLDSTRLFQTLQTKKAD